MRLPDAYLSRREQQLLEILYRKGPMTANDVVASLPDAPTNATVRKLLSILEERGQVEHEEIDGKFYYRASYPREEAGKGVLLNAVETFFAGSMSGTVAALLTGGGKLSESELAEIEELIRKAKEDQR